MLSGINLITQVLLWLNKGIYWFAAKCYSLLIDLANFELFTSDQYSLFGQRIYVLLGVVMLFKLSFSLITYIANPDAISDKQKGAGVLIKKIITSLLLLVATPFIFNGAMSVQKLVIKDNMIPNLILGMGSGDVVEYGAEGEEMSFLVFSSFFRPNPAIFSDDSSTCNATLFDGQKDEEGTSIGGIGSYKMRDECAEVLKNAKGTSFDGTELPEIISWAYTDKNINILTDSDLIKAKSEVDGEKVNTFEFHGLVALVAGGFLAWIMFMFCFDVAVRTIKLAFLQIVAPIPIIAYADPKSDKIFKSWMKQCLSTYFDLFIRLIGVFFAVFIVQQLVYSDAFANNNNDSGIFYNALINIFIIFGALLFAKQLPKLIENIIGIKLDGGFTLSPGKKLASVPGVAKTLGTVGGVYAGAKFGKESGHALRGAVGGLLTGPKGVSEKDGFLGSFTKGANNAAKGIFGKDFKTWSAYDALPGKKRAEDEMKALKDKRNAASNASDIFRAQAQKAAQAGDQETATELFTKAAKYKSAADTYNDQIKSIKTQFRIDESDKDGLNNADKTMNNLEKDIEDAKKKYNNNSDDNNNNNNSNNNNNNNNSNNRNTGTGSDQQITERDARLMNADARVEWENSPNNPANRGRQQQ